MGTWLLLMFVGIVVALLGVFISVIGSFVCMFPKYRKSWDTWSAVSQIVALPGITLALMCWFSLPVVGTVGATRTAMLPIGVIGLFVLFMFVRGELQHFRSKSS
jgi:hypothetical protein